MRSWPLGVLFCAAVAHADEPPCRALELQFKPTSHLQIAIWVEDTLGNFVDTIYVTRSIGALGLGNRPGNSRFKSAFRWPYGRRVMALPVWAHKRGKTYPFVTMGGGRGIDPVDDSIGYHEQVSSTEPFYCPPSMLGLDATSCASMFVGSKGVFMPGKTSVYPPRADLTTFVVQDGQDAATFAQINDVAAVSAATPIGNQLIAPRPRWILPPRLPSGRYLVRLEASREEDFSAAHQHPTFPDVNAELRGFGRDILGQPSVVYGVEITLDGTSTVATTPDYVGYGRWDGETGDLFPPDATIVDQPGSGVGRLHALTDTDGTWRLKALGAGCSGCMPPVPTGTIEATVEDTKVTLAFAAPEGASRYEISYRTGTPLDDDSFYEGVPADSVPIPAAPGAMERVVVTGLKGDTTYHFGVRAVNGCGSSSQGQYISFTTTRQRFTTLEGCFIATAAFGSAHEPHVALLRRLRDRFLLAHPLGQLFVATYYSFSPPLAAAISTAEPLRAAVRQLLFWR